MMFNRWSHGWVLRFPWQISAKIRWFCFVINFGKDKEKINLQWLNIKIIQQYSMTLIKSYDEMKRHLHEVDWVWSSSLVWVVVWSDAPASCAPPAAARPDTPSLCVWRRRAGEGGGLPGRPTSCPLAVREGEEEEGPRRGWEPPPELCPGQTPSLLRTKPKTCWRLSWWGKHYRNTFKNRSF